MNSTNNTTVVFYINKQGGTHSPNLCMEVWEILHWCLEHDIVIRVFHIPGKFIILADRLSRLDRPLKTELALDQSVANSVFQMLNYPNVDLFATRFNHKLPLYVSPVPDSHALERDALSANWNFLHAYAFPPTILNTLCSSQDTSISMQNSFYCSSLASTPVVLRDVTTISISSNSCSAISNITDTIKRKVSTSKSPITCSSCLGIIKQSVKDKKFLQLCRFCLKSRQTSTQKVYESKWVVYSNWCHRKKVNPVSAPLTVITDFLYLPLF